MSSEPSRTLRPAVVPYLGDGDGERFELEKQVTDAATVLMVRGTAGRRAGHAGELEDRWAVTTVERCRR